MLGSPCHQMPSRSPSSRANSPQEHLDVAVQPPNTWLPPCSSPPSQNLHHQCGATKLRVSTRRFPNSCRPFLGQQVGIHELHASPAWLVHGWRNVCKVVGQISNLYLLVAHIPELGRYGHRGVSHWQIQYVDGMRPFCLLRDLVQIEERPRVKRGIRVVLLPFGSN